MANDDDNNVSLVLNIRFWLQVPNAVTLLANNYPIPYIMVVSCSRPGDNPI